MRRVRTDVWHRVGLLLLGVAGLVDVTRGGGPTWGGDPGASFVPGMFLWVLVVMCGVWLMHDVARGRLWDGTARDAASPGLRGIAGATLFALSMVAYAMALPRLGFLATTIPFSIAWSIVLSRTEGVASPVQAGIGISAVVLFTLTLYLVFVDVLRVPIG